MPGLGASAEVEGVAMCCRVRSRGPMRRVWRGARRTAHLDAGIRRRAQQHELAAPLQRAPGRVLDQVRPLLVRQPRDDLKSGARLDMEQT